MDPNSEAGTPVYNRLKTVNSRCFIVCLLLAGPMGLVFTHVYKNDDVPNIFCKIFCQQQILTTQSLLYLVSMSASLRGGQQTVQTLLLLSVKATIVICTVSLQKKWFAILSTCAQPCSGGENLGFNAQ